jgi:methionyl-tRNA formyltransferase
MPNLSISKNPRIAVAGSVNSSARVLRKLIEHKMNVQWVLGLDPAVSKNVSGYNDLEPIANSALLDFSYFQKLNDDWILKGIRDREIDFFFVVGLSQLVRKDLLEAPNVSCIGYHPTELPKGRGRAAIAWIIMEKVKPAASFFLMDEGTDSGHIIAQKPTQLDGTEYPQEVIDKIMVSIDEAMDEVLPSMKDGEIPYHIQDETQASYLGKRAPSDGYLDWELPAKKLQRLIRAVSHPLPGAITFLGDKEIKVWQAEVWNSEDIAGVPGRIVRLLENSFVVCTGDKHLEIINWDGVKLSDLIEGQKLGINWVVLYRKIFING